MLFIKYFFCQENFTVEPNNNDININDPLNDYIGYNKIINLTTNYDGNKYILSIYPKTDCYDYDKSNDCLENILVLVNYDEYQQKIIKYQEDSEDNVKLCKLKYQLECNRNIDKKKESNPDSKQPETNQEPNQETNQEPNQEPNQETNPETNLNIPGKIYQECIDTTPDCLNIQYNNTEFSLVKTKPFNSMSGLPAYKLIGNVNGPQKNIMNYTVSTAGEYSTSNLVCLDGDKKTDIRDPTATLEIIRIPNQTGSENKFIIRIAKYELVGTVKKHILNDTDGNPIITSKYIGLCKQDNKPNTCTMTDKKYSRLCLYDKEDNPSVLQFQINIVNTSK